MKRTIGIKRSIFLSYIFVSLVPLLILTITFIIYSFQLYKQTNEYNEYVQNQITSNISESMLETRYISSTIYSEQSLNSILKLQDRYQYYRDESVTSFIQYLTATKKYSNKISSLYLYIESTDTVLSELGILNSVTYYNLNEADGSYSYEEWIAHLQKTTFNESYETVQKKDGNYMHYYLNLARTPFIVSEYNTAITFVISIPESFYFRSADNVNWYSSCDTYVFDSNKKLLLTKLHTNTPLRNPESIAEVTNYNKDKKILSTFVSNGAATQWTVLTVVDRFNHIKTPMYMSLLSVILFLLCISSLSLIIYYLAEKNYSPIQKLTSLLGKDEEYTEFEAIHNSITALISKNEKYSDDIQKQKQVLQKILLNKLLNGSINDNLAYSLQSYDINFTNDNFFVAIFVVNALENNFTTTGNYELLIQTFADMITEKLKEENTMCYFTQEDAQFICIANTQQDTVSFLENIYYIVQDCCDLICMDFSVTIKASISNIHKSYLGVSKSYLEALEALSHASDIRTNILMHQNLKDKRRLYFSLKQENSLIIYFQTGDFLKVKEALSEIFADTTVLKSLYTEPILYDITCMYLKLPYIVDLSDDSELLSEITMHNFYSRINNTEEFYDFIYTISEKICNFVLRQKSGSREQILNNVIHYIHSNCSDGNLTIVSICDYMHLSNSYLTKLFKNKYNITIHEYIHQYRIKMAKQMIVQHVPIHTVCEKVGYINSRSFNRIFKKYESVSPSEYKALHALQPKDTTEQSTD